MNLFFRKASFFSFILTAGAFFLLSNACGSTYNFNENCRLSYQAILNLRFAEAGLRLAKERTRDPENLIPVYLENYIDCLKLFISEEQPVYEVLRKNKSARIAALEKGDRQSPYYRFCLAQVHLQWAFARLKFNDYSLAANEVRKAYALLSENAALFPDFTLNSLGLGITHATIGLIPAKFRWISDLLGFQGTVEQGMAEIDRVAEYAGTDMIVSLFVPEAGFYYSFLTANLLQDRSEALRFIGASVALNSEWVRSSPLLLYTKAAIFMRTGHNDEAIRLLTDRNRGSSFEYSFHYLDYMEGMARLNALDYSAERNFQFFIKNFRGRNYISSARQRLAWIAFLKGDSVAYLDQLQLIKKKTDHQVDEDKQVGYETSESLFPSYRLLRARLLCDGGYYSSALDELLDHPVSGIVRTKRDRVEYPYRLARIWHESGNTKKALEYYDKTILTGRGYQYYYAAAASLYSGQIHEIASNWKDAVRAYECCLELKPDEYKNSLHQKAKAGLTRISSRLKAETDRRGK